MHDMEEAIVPKHTKRTSAEETTCVRLEKKEEVKEEKKGKEGVEDSDKDTEDSNKPGDETDYKPQNQEGQWVLVSDS